VIERRPKGGLRLADQAEVANNLSGTAREAV